MSRRRGLLALVAITVAAGLIWDTLGTFSSAAWGQEDVIIIERAHEGAHQPSFDRPIFVLVLGSDARGGLPDRTRYDSIQIVGLDPETRRGTIVGLPRDSYVQSAVGNGTRKLTDLGVFDGPAGFVRTMERFSGCSFDYTMRVAFEGFAGPFWRSRNPDRNARGGLINAIGGVTINVPSPGVTDRDALHHLDPIPPGRQVLNGPQALAWSRMRKTSARPRGDFSRSEAQGELMLAVLAELRRAYAENPGTAIRNIAAVRRLVDMRIPSEEMLRLGLFALKIAPRRIDNIVADGFATSANGASIVRITERGRRQLADVCADGLLGS